MRTHRPQLIHNDGLKSNEFDESGSRVRIVFLGNKYFDISSISFDGGGIDISIKVLNA